MALTAAPVHFALTGARLKRPIRVTFRVGSVNLPSDLPETSRAGAVWLAFYNTTSGLWQPVASTYDPATRTVTALVNHLSWWAPWTWNWQGFSLQLRQLLSALGAGRAPDINCAEIPRVTVTSAGGHDPPLAGCTTTRGSGNLTVSLTDNRGLSEVISGVPPDAKLDPPSYHGFYAYLATRPLATHLLGGADVPPAENLTYSLPLHGPPAIFTAEPTVTSYAFDVINAVGEAFAGELNYQKINAEYASCALNVVARSQPASLADVPDVAVKCMSALAQAVPALKFLGGTALKLILLDARFILQDFDLGYDDFRGVSGRVNVARPAAVIPLPRCPKAAPGVPAALVRAVAEQPGSLCQFEIDHLKYDPQDSSWALFALSPLPGIIAQGGSEIAHEENGVWRVVSGGSAPNWCSDGVPAEVVASFGLSCP